MVNSVKGCTEVKGDKNCGFMSIGGMIDMIEGAEESCFSRMIASVCSLVRVEIGGMLRCVVQDVRRKVIPICLICC